MRLLRENFAKLFSLACLLVGGTFVFKALNFGPPNPPPAFPTPSPTPSSGPRDPSALSPAEQKTLLFFQANRLQIPQPRSSKPLGESRLPPELRRLLVEKAVEPATISRADLDDGRTAYLLRLKVKDLASSYRNARRALVMTKTNKRRLLRAAMLSAAALVEGEADRMLVRVTLWQDDLREPAAGELVAVFKKARKLPAKRSAAPKPKSSSAPVR